MSNSIFYYVSELPTFDGTGIQRVANAIYVSIRKILSNEWDVVPVYGGADGSFHKAASFESRLGVASYNGREEVIEPVSGDIILSVDLVYNITSEHQKELARLRSSGVGIFFVVHDLIPLQYPQLFSGESIYTANDTYFSLFRNWVDVIVKEADGIVCVSKTVQQDVSSWLNANVSNPELKPKLGYFHHGCDLNPYVSTDKLSEEDVRIISSISNKPSFLLVGTLEPRKGHLLALDAFDRLWQEEEKYNLIFVGKAGNTSLFSKEADDIVNRIKQHSKFNDQLFWLSGISDEYLAKIYMSSTALLQLSKAEGFGLPLIEAANCKLPIIARDIQVNREVCDEGAFYFNGNSGEELTVIIKEWLSLYKDGSHPDPSLIRTLTWKESARQLLSVIGKMRDLDFMWA